MTENMWTTRKIFIRVVLSILGAIMLFVLLTGRLPGILWVANGASCFREVGRIRASRHGCLWSVESDTEVHEVAVMLILVIVWVKHDTPALEGLITPGLSKIRANLLDRWARPGEDETRQEGMINMSKNQPSHGSVLAHATPLYATTGGFKFEVVVTPSEV
jgi:hypothetical protein